MTLPVVASNLKLGSSSSRTSFTPVAPCCRLTSKMSGQARGGEVVTRDHIIVTLAFFVVSRRIQARTGDIGRERGDLRKGREEKMKVLSSAQNSPRNEW